MPGRGADTHPPRPPSIRVAFMEGPIKGVGGPAGLRTPGAAPVPAAAGPIRGADKPPSPAAGGDKGSSTRQHLPEPRGEAVAGTGRAEASLLRLGKLRGFHFWGDVLQNRTYPPKPR